MKTKLTVMLVLAFLTCLHANASYNAKLETRVANQSSGLGKVYSGTENTYEGDYPDSPSISNQDDSAGGVEKTFYAFAKSNDEDNIRFLGWSTQDDGDVISTDNPYEVKVATSSSKGGVNTLTLYANFYEVKRFTISLIQPEVGTISISDGTNTITNTGSLTTEEKVNLKATTVEGYNFLAWYYMKDGEKVYFSSSDSLSNFFDEDVQVGADFLTDDVPIFGIKGKSICYPDINKANEVASEGDIIYMKYSGLVREGEYAIKKGVTLLVPFDEDNTCYTAKPQCVTSYSKPSPYRTLTLCEGAKLVVDGELSVSANLMAAGSGSSNPCGATTGACGTINMESGSSIELNDGAKMYVWGYVLGNGEVVAHDGSEVYEPMQITDFRGGTVLIQMNNNSQRVFPQSQYYVQNIEAPLTLEYGATENVLTAFYANKVKNLSDASTYIGDAQGMFLMGEGSSLTKKYDGTCDRQVYSINGNVNLNNLIIRLSGGVAQSQNYVLPIQNNMTINIDDGQLEISTGKDVALLPGAEIVVGKKAVLSLNEANLYVYDKDQWGKYAYNNFLRVLPYAPSKKITRKYENLTDARIDVKGSVKGTGMLYTTAGGADICCSEGVGVVEFESGYAEDTVYQVLQSTSITYVEIPVTTAQLHNGDGTYVKPNSSMEKNTKYYYVEGVWTTEAPVIECEPEIEFDDEDHQLKLENDGALPVDVLAKVVEERVAENETILSVDLTNVESFVDGEDTVSISDIRDVLVEKTGNENLLLFASSNEEKCANVIVEKPDGKYEAEEINISDKQAISTPVEFVAKSITYGRKNTTYKGFDHQWGTICLPFELESDESVQFYRLRGMLNGKIILDPVDRVEANEPAIYAVASGDNQVEMNNENVLVKPFEETEQLDEVYLVGVVDKPKVLTPNSGDFFISNNKFWAVSDKPVTVAPQRAYISSKNEINIKSFAISTDEGLVDIVTAVDREAEDFVSVHNVQGIRMQKVGKGLNIVTLSNGKMVKVYK